MKILVTGAKGFVGKNLVSELKSRNFNQIYEYDLDSKEDDLDKYCRTCDFVFHLAGVNRPKEQSEYLKGNFGFTSTLLKKLKLFNNKSPIMLASSIQAALKNPYGISKKAGEDLLNKYRDENDSKVLIYRFPNIFGKWCKPNYNSAVATFSYNIGRGLPINIINPDTEMNLIYIDDLVNELINALKGRANKKDNFCFVKPVYKIKLGEIAKLLYNFKDSRVNLSIPNTDDKFIKKLYATYLSYLPKNDLIYDLNMNIDQRGSFTEFIKTNERGQISVNISKPGIIKGNHWHKTKVEKFMVVNGRGIIRLRKIDEYDVTEYYVSGEKLQVIDIPPGYTHNIENIGTNELVTIIWVNEKFDPKNPDTILLEV